MGLGLVLLVDYVLCTTEDFMLVRWTGVTDRNVLEGFSYVKCLITRSNKVDFVIAFNCMPILLDDIGEVV